MRGQARNSLVQDLFINNVDTGQRNKTCNVQCLALLIIHYLTGVLPFNTPQAGRAVCTVHHRSATCSQFRCRRGDPLHLSYGAGKISLVLYGQSFRFRCVPELFDTQASVFNTLR